MYDVYLNQRNDLLVVRRGICAIGEYAPDPSPDGVVHSIVPMDVDGLSLWRDLEFTASLAESNVGVIVLGGAWLEEDVFIGDVRYWRMRTFHGGNLGSK